MYVSLSDSQCVYLSVGMSVRGVSYVSDMCLRVVRVCVFCARDENSAEGHVADVVQAHDAANIMADLGLRTGWVQVLLYKS